MKKKIRYIRPALGREEPAEIRRSRRALCALTVIEMLLLVLSILLMVDILRG